MKAIIKKVTRGKKAGQYKFILKGDNGENLSQQETYTQKHNVTEVLEKYFPNFKVEDQTGEVGTQTPRTVTTATGGSVQLGDGGQA